MQYSGAPVWVWITLAAWVACGIYFLASAFATQRIRQREARGARAKDSGLLLGGYVLLFIQLPPRATAWNARFVPPHAAAVVGTIGAVLAVLGLSLTAWARAALGRYWSRVVALKDDHKLVQSGPYRFVRHPLYSGLLTATLGAALAFGWWHSLLGVVLLWIGFISRAHREDALLAGQFGEEFAAYRARSGRLLPRFGTAGDTER